MTTFTQKQCEGEQEEYESVEAIPPDNYATTQEEAIKFPKFLSQITQIGIDLLRVSSTTAKLTQLRVLEVMRGPNLAPQIQELESYMLSNSDYYSDCIENDENVKREFWENFRITHDGGRRSWPHFLFNLCGI